MHKELLDFKGREIPAAYANGRKYNFNVKLKEDAGFNQDYLVPGNKSKVMVDLHIDKTYEIKENSISGNPASDLSDYDSSIQWETWDGTQSIESIDGTHLDQFVVPRGGSENDPLNTKITVTNQEKALGKMVIKKTFNPSDLRGSVANGVRSGLYGSTPKYKITVVGTNPYGGDDEVYREVHELSAGQEKTIENLPYGHYTVSEPGQEPAPNFVDSDGANDDGKVDLLIDKKEATVEIINRPKDNDYKTEVTASKHWVNGPEADHTAPDLELYADGVLKTDAEPTVTPGDGTANEFTYVWTDLQKYNQSGNEIVYTVKERGVTADHNVVVHGHTYAVTQEGNKITNTYTQPQTDEDVKAYKTWADADGFNPKPEIKFELWRRNGTAGDGEAVAGTQENPNPQVVPESGEVNFGKQLKTDVNGVEYEYYVRETFTNEYERNNWIVTGEGTLEVTNTLLGEADRGGKLTIRKVLKNEATDEPGLRGASVRPGGDNALKFKFVVKGPNGYSKEVELKAGEEITLDKLLYGMYKVEEIENHGFATSYDPENGEGLVEANPVTVTVTNTNDGRDELNVKKTIKKVWVNGDKPAIKIQLWRKGTAADGTAIDEMVNEFTTTAGKDSEKEFTKTSQGVLLAKYDPQGNAYEYYAKEENVPENYKATYSDDKLTVTNTYVKSENQKPDVKPNPSSVKVHKVKTDDSSALNLYGGTGAAAILLIALMLAFRRRAGRKEQK